MKKRKTKTHVRRARKKKAVLDFPRAWTMLLKTAGFVFVIGVGAILVSFDPRSLSSYFSASVVSEPEVSPAGILLTHQQGHPNEEKLREIFHNVFPSLSLEVLSLEEEVGKAAMANLKPQELPSLSLEKSAFERAPLSHLVRDLFQEGEGYYHLLTPLVNPSYQLVLKDLGAQVTSTPVSVVIYTDLTCLDCRVFERNTEVEWQELVAEGMASLEIRNLPERGENAATVALAECFPEIRSTLLTRVNLTEEYIDRELKKRDLDRTSCDLDGKKSLFEGRRKEIQNYGVTSLPVTFIGRSGSHEWTRITGAKEFSEYQKVIDDILRQ